MESISPDQKTIVFISESIENIPNGFRAKETYQIVSDNEFMETFELAEPGKDFELYSKAIMRRAKGKTESHEIGSQDLPAALVVLIITATFPKFK